MKRISNRSKINLKNVDERMSLIVGAVLARGNVDFTVTSGFRTVQEQKSLYAQGRTKSGKKVTNADGVKNKSRHQSGKAIDIIPYPFKGWDDVESFREVAEEFKYVAKHFNVEIEWGGDWKSFKDYPHLQLK